MMWLVDTNLLVRLADTNSPHHATVTEALARLEDAGQDLVIVPQLLYQYWVVATRQIANNGLGRDVPTTLADLQDFMALFRLLRDERGIFERWRDLVTTGDVKGKVAHDARLVAAMLRHGVTHLLTFNGADFRRFTGLQVISPAEVLSGSLPS